MRGHASGRDGIRAVENAAAEPRRYKALIIGLCKRVRRTRADRVNFPQRQRLPPLLVSTT
jgi:hypothetical protein